MVEDIEKIEGLVALLTLSGAQVLIGRTTEMSDSTADVWIQVEADQAEPTYMSRKEAAMLIAALKVAMEPE